MSPYIRAKFKANILREHNIVTNLLLHKICGSTMLSPLCYIVGWLLSASEKQVSVAVLNRGENYGHRGPSRAHWL